MNEQYSFSIYQWTIVFALFACMKSLIDKNKDESFVCPSIFALRCARTLAACLELLHGMICQDTFDLGKDPQSVGDGYAVPLASVSSSIAFCCLPFHLSSIPFLWLGASSLPFLVARLVIIGYAFRVHNSALNRD